MLKHWSSLVNTLSAIQLNTQIEYHSLHSALKYISRGETVPEFFLNNKMKNKFNCQFKA